MAQLTPIVEAGNRPFRVRICALIATGMALGGVYLIKNTTRHGNQSVTVLQLWKFQFYSRQAFFWSRPGLARAAAGLEIQNSFQI